MVSHEVFFDCMRELGLPKERTVRKVDADTFKTEGKIEIRFTPNQTAAGVKEWLRRGPEKHKAWLKDTLKTVQEYKSMKPTKRLLTLKETVEYFGLSARTLYNRIGTRSKNPFPVKPKPGERRVWFDIEELNRYIEPI